MEVVHAILLHQGIPLRELVRLVVVEGRPEVPCRHRPWQQEGLQNRVRDGHRCRHLREHDLQWSLTASDEARTPAAMTMTMSIPPRDDGPQYDHKRVDRIISNTGEAPRNEENTPTPSTKSHTSDQKPSLLLKSFIYRVITYMHSSELPIYFLGWYCNAPE